MAHVATVDQVAVVVDPVAASGVIFVVTHIPFSSWRFSPVFVLQLPDFDSFAVPKNSKSTSKLSPKNEGSFLSVKSAISCSSSLISSLLGGMKSNISLSTDFCRGIEKDLTELCTTIGIHHTSISCLFIFILSTIICSQMINLLSLSWLIIFVKTKICGLSIPLLISASSSSCSVFTVILKESVWASGLNLSNVIARLGKFDSDSLSSINQNNDLNNVVSTFESGS
ncbi:hypothetical protein GW750_09080 [bacterium]|nr:hypothetical protein [bacterium]